MTTGINSDLFNQIGNQSIDGFFIYSVSSKKFTYSNTALARIWEMDFFNTTGFRSNLKQRIHPEDVGHVLSCYEECLEDWKAKRYEFRLLMPGGTVKYIKASIYPLEEDGHILAGIVEDISIEQYNKIHIEQINARKNITLEVLSHDLKEPLGMMRLIATGMEKEIANLGSGALMESLDFIKAMCERNMLLVRSVINKEFLKSAEVDIKKERTDIVSELQAVMRFYKRSHLRLIKNFKFSSTVDKIYLPVDTMKFLQVINNLISNAIKFTADHGDIGLHVDELKDVVLISVQDNGIGIPVHLQQDLFSQMPEALRPGLKGEESGGLGMGIIKAIVELHQGKIWFESKEGIGTTFFIELPK